MSSSPKVRLMIHVRRSDGKRAFVDPVRSGNGKLRPQYAMVNGKTEHHPESTYYLRYSKNGKRVWEPVGDDAQLAMIAHLKRERALAAKQAGVEVIDEENMEQTGRPLSEAVSDYLDEVKQLKARRTHTAYAEALALFVEALPRATINSLDRKSVIRYMAHLKAKGNSPRTVANRVSFLRTFFLNQKIAWPLMRSDNPTYTEPVVVSYSADEIRRLMATLDRDEYELFQFFLCTGARDAEVQYATWRDIDFDQRTFAVTEKLDLGFTPKDKEEGLIPVPDSLIEMLRERRKRYPNTRLIFPGLNGGADGHYLRILKRAALKAGLNCEHCYNKAGECCATKPVCKRWKLHTFRKSFATWHHETAGVSARTLQRWLRHSSLDTTLRYLAASDDNSKRTREQVNSTFAFARPA